MTRNEILNTPEIVDFMIDKSVMVDSKMKLHKRLDELCKLALKALEQEPCEDCVSRQAAKRALEDRFIELQKRHDDKRYETNYCLNTILELPSVNPQKSGWIPVSERLPEDGGNYLVTIAFDLGDKEPVREVKKDYFCILSKKWLYEEKNVVAWMPLPKSFEPKESEVEE